MDIYGYTTKFKMAATAILNKEKVL